MNKANLMIPLCIFLASGCALFEAPENDQEKNSTAAPVREAESSPAPPIAATAPKEAPSIEPRSLTRDDVRRIQLRLKEAGFDPGPADGIAGARTKTAFNRYQSGCAKVKPLLDDFNDASAANSKENSLNKKTPSRQDTQALQSQLRSAGFDPGPADGIFGPRTRKTLTQLKSNCPTMTEVAAALNAPAPAPGKKIAVQQASAPADPMTRSRSVRAAVPSETANRVAATSPARSQEEIRILQLRLRDAGFDPGAFDGVMGPKTRSALQQYEAGQAGKKLKTSLKANIGGQY